MCPFVPFIHSQLFAAKKRMRCEQRVLHILSRGVCRSGMCSWNCQISRCPPRPVLPAPETGTSRCCSCEGGECCAGPLAALANHPKFNALRQAAAWPGKYGRSLGVWHAKCYGSCEEMYSGTTNALCFVAHGTHGFLESGAAASEYVEPGSHRDRKGASSFRAWDS